MPVTHADAALLRLVREWRPPATLHPIAMQAWHSYQDGGKPLSDDSVQIVGLMPEDTPLLEPFFQRVSQALTNVGAAPPVPALVPAPGSLPDTNIAAVEQPR